MITDYSHPKFVSYIDDIVIIELTSLYTQCVLYLQCACFCVYADDFIV